MELSTCVPTFRRSGFWKHYRDGGALWGRAELLAVDLLSSFFQGSFLPQFSTRHENGNENRLGGGHTRNKLPGVTQALQPPGLGFKV